jgi:hypothetical protein
MSIKTRSQPSLAKASAQAKPIPLAPPVISAVRPASEKIETMKNF